MQSPGPTADLLNQEVGVGPRRLSCKFQLEGPGDTGGLSWWGWGGVQGTLELSPKDKDLAKGRGRLF